MKLTSTILVLALLAPFAALKAEPAPSTVSPALKAAYPLTTCVVSDEALEGGGMGGPIDYIHKEAGQPDRLVRFCCSDCVKDFKKDPAKYLAKIDAAAKSKAAPKADAAHTGHMH